MGSYAFLTTWCFQDAAIADAFELLRDSAGYPRWWKSVIATERLEQGDAEGVGELTRFQWRGALPYLLSFDLRVSRLERPYLIEGRASGELDGIGLWRLYEGQGLAVVYEWRVRTTKGWMNLAGPLARPAFAWNHDLVMREGARGFAGALGAALIVHD
ncbi:MAG: SRPBCC family protein [Solirubrobacterales bacterium]|nr:SRPBCC family protein [Solirubrobacterales bacterium]MBV9472070.1 SRPBCC family protein [Solirubrobacterales bacterium]